MSKKLIALCLLATGATPAYAAENGATGEFEYTAYSDNLGHRTVGTIQTSLDLGGTTLVAEAAGGVRQFSTESFSGFQGELSVYHDWSDILSTRTSASAATDDIVFIKHSIEHDFNVKLLPKTVFLAGVKYAEYDAGIKALILSSGATRYFKRGFINYRYSYYAMDDRSNTHSHLFSARLNDSNGEGYTQLWLGRGTALQEFDFAAAPFTGHTTGVALRRVQPLEEQLKLNLTLGRDWFDTKFENYTGTTGKIGLTMNW